MWRKKLRVRNMIWRSNKWILIRIMDYLIFFVFLVVNVLVLILVSIYMNFVGLIRCCKSLRRVMVILIWVVLNVLSVLWLMMRIDLMVRVWVRERGLFCIMKMVSNVGMGFEGELMFGLYVLRLRSFGV